MGLCTVRGQNGYPVLFLGLPLGLNVDCDFKRDAVFAVPLVWSLWLKVIEFFVHFGRSQSAGHAF